MHNSGLQIMEKVGEKCENELEFVMSKFKELELTHTDEIEKREKAIREKQDKVCQKILFEGSLHVKPVLQASVSLNFESRFKDCYFGFYL